MALTNVDYKLTLTSAYSETSETFQNVFWYKASSTSGTALDLCENWVTDVAPAIADIISSDTLLLEIESYNLVDDTDFASMSVTLAGTRPGVSMNAWDSWGFRYLRPQRGMHNGSKRFGSVAIADVANGVGDPTIVGLCAALAVVLESTFPNPGLVFYSPCVVKTVEVPNSTGDGTHYEPDTLLVCTDVSFTGLTTQNTRKR